MFFLLGVVILLACLWWYTNWKYTLCPTYFDPGEYYDEQPCYLCCEKVPLEEWVSGGHRKTCLKRNKSLIKKHPLRRDLASKCPKCQGCLRMWTRYRLVKMFEGKEGDKKEINDTFVCEKCWPEMDPRKAYSPWEKENKDDNRFNCFSCDFDICKKCIVKQEKKYREDCEEQV